MRTGRMQGSERCHLGQRAAMSGDGSQQTGRRSAPTPLPAPAQRDHVDEANAGAAAGRGRPEWPSPQGRRFYRSLLPLRLSRAETRHTTRAQSVHEIPCGARQHNYSSHETISASRDHSSPWKNGRGRRGRSQRRLTPFFHGLPGKPPQHLASDSLGLKHGRSFRMLENLRCDQPTIATR